LRACAAMLRPTSHRAGPASAKNLVTQCWQSDTSASCSSNFAQFALLAASEEGVHVRPPKFSTPALTLTPISIPHQIFKSLFKLLKRACYTLTQMHSYMRPQKFSTPALALPRSPYTCSHTHTTICVLMLLYVTAYYCICVFILVYVCSYYYRCGLLHLYRFQLVFQLVHSSLSSTNKPL
jgi:hypothetical protein